MKIFRGEKKRGTVSQIKKKKVQILKFKIKNKRREQNLNRTLHIIISLSREFKRKNSGCI